MSAAQSGNRLDSSSQGSGQSGLAVGLAIASSLLIPAVSHAQMQALPPPPSAPSVYPSADFNPSAYPAMPQPMGIPVPVAPASAYPLPGQGSPSYGGSYQVIVYGGSPYLLRQIKFLEPNASLQNYQGRQVIVAGSFDSPAAAQERVLRLSDFGVGAQTISTNSGGFSPPANGMAAPPPVNLAAPPSVAPMGMPGNPLPPASVVPLAIAPTGMPTSPLPPASVTPPMAIAPMGVPMPAPDFPTSTPSVIPPSGMPMAQMPGVPLEATMAPAPGMPVNSFPPGMPPGMPIAPPMGSSPLGAATISPPSGPVPGNSDNPSARFQVVIPTRTENFSSLTNRLISMGVSPYSIQAKQQPRGSHLAIGPYAQFREAEAMTRILKMNGMDARVFHSR